MTDPISVTASPDLSDPQGSLSDASTGQAALVSQGGGFLNMHGHQRSSLSLFLGFLIWEIESSDSHVRKDS